MLLSSIKLTELKLREEYKAQSYGRNKETGHATSKTTPLPTSTVALTSHLSLKTSTMEDAKHDKIGGGGKKQNVPTTSKDHPSRHNKEIKTNITHRITDDTTPTTKTAIRKQKPKTSSQTKQKQEKQEKQKREKHEKQQQQQQQHTRCLKLKRIGGLRDTGRFGNFRLTRFRNKIYAGARERQPIRDPVYEPAGIYVYNVNTRERVSIIIEGIDIQRARAYDTTTHQELDPTTKTLCELPGAATRVVSRILFSTNQTLILQAGETVLQLIVFPASVFDFVMNETHTIAYVLTETGIFTVIVTPWTIHVYEPSGSESEHPPSPSPAFDSILGAELSLLDDTGVIYVAAIVHGILYTIDVRRNPFVPRLVHRTHSPLLPRSLSHSSKTDPSILLCGCMFGILVFDIRRPLRPRVVFRKITGNSNIVRILPFSGVKNQTKKENKREAAAARFNGLQFINVTFGVENIMQLIELNVRESHPTINYHGQQEEKPILKSTSPTTTEKATPTPIQTAKATPIPTPTPTPIQTAKATPIPTATATPIPTATATPLPTSTTSSDKEKSSHSNSTHKKQLIGMKVVSSERITNGYIPYDVLIVPKTRSHRNTRIFVSNTNEKPIDVVELI